MLSPDAALIPTLLDQFQQRPAANDAAYAVVVAEYGNYETAKAAGIDWDQWNGLRQTARKFALAAWTFYVGQRKAPPSPGDLTPGQANMLIDHLQDALTAFLTMLAGELAAAGH